MTEKAKKHKTINVAILAEEPLGWGSGKHYFPTILNDYNWKNKENTYQFKTQYLFDKDIIAGKLNVSNYDVLLAPGGGVGDGHAIAKGFNNRKVKKWKKQIQIFVKDGGGFVGICGGTAFFTDIDTGNDTKPKTFLEKQYSRSSLGLSCVKHYYKDLAFPLLYPSQKKCPEKIGATAYVFSFAPGETKDGKLIHTGGVPVDFVISKDNPIFSDYKGDTLRIRWWGGPGLTVPDNPDREVNILATYPKEDFSENPKTRIHAWAYKGGIFGLKKSFFKSLLLIKKAKSSLKDVPMYAYFLAKPWKKSDKYIKLNFSDKPSITTEIYPNENKGRILLCTSHPEYMIWWGGHIEERPESNDVCLGTGFRKWRDIEPLSETVRDELTYTWWVVRRFTAWAAKVPDEEMPPIEKGEINKNAKEILKTNIFWDGSLEDQMKNI